MKTLEELKYRLLILNKYGFVRMQVDELQKMYTSDKDGVAFGHWLRANDVIWSENRVANQITFVKKQNEEEKLIELRSR